MAGKFVRYPHLGRRRSNGVAGTKSTKVEDKLPEVFRSFEIHQLRMDWQKEKRQRDEAQRLRLWEAAMTEAKRRYRDHARWEHFKSRSQEWHRIEQHRTFLLALQPAIDNYDDGRGDELRSLVAFAQAKLDQPD